MKCLLCSAHFPSVFECAYAQLVLPWYCVPEPLESQPLHQVLCREFDFVIDKVISRVKDLDVCSAVVGSVRILTQHLHNAKQSDRWESLPGRLPSWGFRVPENSSCHLCHSKTFQSALRPFSVTLLIAANWPYSINTLLFLSPSMNHLLKYFTFIGSPHMTCHT